MSRVGGKKGKRTKSGTVVSTYTPIAKIGELQMYAQVENILGGPHIMVKCYDGKQRMAVIPGKFKGRKHWLQKGTFVLLNLREYEDKKADVIYVYSQEDVKYLRSIKELETEILPTEEEESEIEFNNADIKSIETGAENANNYDDVYNLPDNVDFDSL
jgi:translation initiation factor 1A